MKHILRREPVTVVIFAISAYSRSLRSGKCGLTFSDSYTATAQKIVDISASNFSKFQRKNVDLDSDPSAMKDVS
jgi:hypothetical protein